MVQTETLYVAWGADKYTTYEVSHTVHNGMFPIDCNSCKIRLIFNEYKNITCQYLPSFSKTQFPLNAKCIFGQLFNFFFYTSYWKRSVCEFHDKFYFFKIQKLSDFLKNSFVTPNTEIQA